MEHTGHIPVLLNECIEALAIKPEGIYVDATLGGAGHAQAVLEKLSPNGRLYGIDRDTYALSRAAERLQAFSTRVTFVHANFRELGPRLTQAGVEGIDGILFDLGVSSFQLDQAQRGFSYMQDAPLDMRMDQSSGSTAGELVNSLSPEELSRILFEYGEERFAMRIASAIVQARSAAPIQTTGELVDIVRGAIPSAAARKERQHPAKRTFQAIRMAVNDELASIADALDAAVSLLKPGGRIAVITFHSLEDRLVKQTFARMSRGCTCPPEFPVCICGKKPIVKLVPAKPIVPGSEEIETNPRARSAKLRVAEKQ